jgi:hypothetical protein
VVLATKLAADFRKRRLGYILGQVHGNLPRINDGARIIFCLDLQQPESKLLGDGFLDGLDGDLAGLRVDEVLQHLLRIWKRDLGVGQRRVSD